MTLSFIKDIHGVSIARRVSSEIEYEWIVDSENDSFYNEERLS